MADTIIDPDAQIQAAFESLKSQSASFGTSVGEALKAVEVQTGTKAPVVDVEDPGPPPEPDTPAKPAPAPAAKSAAKSDPKPAAKSSFAPPDQDAAPEPSKPADDLPPRDAIKGKHASHWNKMRDELDQLRAARAELEAKLSKTTPSIDDSEIKRLREERDAYSAQLKAVAFDLHPETRAQYEPQLKSAIELAKSIVGSEHAGKITELLSQPPSRANLEAIKEIASNLDSFEQSRLASAVGQRDRVHAELAEKRANSEKELRSYQERQAEARRQQENARAERFKNDLAWAQKEWSSFPTFAEKSNDPEHNARVAQARSEVEQIFQGGLDPKELASAAHWAVVGKALAPQNKALMVKVSELEAEIAALRKSEPGAGSPSATTPAPAEEENLSFGDIVLKQLGRAR